MKCPAYRDYRAFLTARADFSGIWYLSWTYPAASLHIVAIRSVNDHTVPACGVPKALKTATDKLNLSCADFHFVTVDFRQFFKIADSLCDAVNVLLSRLQFFS